MNFNYQDPKDDMSTPKNSKCNIKKKKNLSNPQIYSPN